MQQDGFFLRKATTGQDMLSRCVEVIFDAERGACVLAQKPADLKADGIGIHDDVLLPISVEAHDHMNGLSAMLSGYSRNCQQTAKTLA